MRGSPDPALFATAGLLLDWQRLVKGMETFGQSPVRGRETRAQRVVMFLSLMPVTWCVIFTDSHWYRRWARECFSIFEGREIRVDREEYQC